MKDKHPKPTTLSTEELQLIEQLREHPELMERFKTSNALLQNSLSYVGLLSTSPAFIAHDARLAPATGALAAAIELLIPAAPATDGRRGTGIAGKPGRPED